jgi:hypothetical protein
MAWDFEHLHRALPSRHLQLLICIIIPTTPSSISVTACSTAHGQITYYWFPANAEFRFHIHGDKRVSFQFGVTAHFFTRREQSAMYDMAPRWPLQGKTTRVGIADFPVCQPIFSLSLNTSGGGITVHRVTRERKGAALGGYLRSRVNG